MEQSNPHTIATFTGTLLKRERAADNRLVQLVFREGHDNVLCVSSNPADAAWPVGEDYRIEGVYRQSGKRSVIVEPTIARVRRHKKLFKVSSLRKLSFNQMLVIAVVLSFVGMVYGVITLLHPSHPSQGLGASTNTASQANSSTATSPTTDSTTQQPTTSASTSQTTPIPSSATKKASTPTSTAPATTTPPAAQTPTSTGTPPTDNPPADNNPPAQTDPGATDPGTTDSGTTDTTPNS